MRRAIVALLAGSLALSGCGRGGAPAPLPATGAGRVLYELPDRTVHLVEAVAHGTDVDLSARLHVAGPAAISPDGTALVASTDDGCLAVSTGDFRKLEKVTSHGVCVAQYAETAHVSGGGTVVVFNASGTHPRDLFLVRRNGSDDWGQPRSLTGSGPYEYNKLPRLNADASAVVYDCSHGAESDEGTNVCEVGLAGGTVRTLLSAPLDGWTAFHSPAYRPGGGLVFECHHPGEELVCALPPGAHAPTRLTAPGVSNDNSPCVLPDGRVASLVDTGIHTLRVVDASGTNPVTVVDRQDILDVGIFCG
jgi:hypothetical protein